MKRCIAICLVIVLGMAMPALAFWTEVERVYVTDEMWEHKWDEVVPLACEPVKYLAQRNYNGWSLLDADGRVIEDSWFEYFYDFHEGLATFTVMDKYGVVNEMGEIIVPAQYESMSNYSEGLAAVLFERTDNGSHGDWGYIDAEGERVLGSYYTAEAFQNGYAVVSAEGTRWEGSGQYYLPAFGVIDREGNVVIDMIYDSLTLNKDGTVKASLGGEDYYFSMNIDTEKPEANRWQALIALKCDPVQYLGRMGDYWSLMDAEHNVVQADWLDGFDGFDENGLATVRIRGKWGLLRDDGTLAVEPKFDYIGSFCSGRARYEAGDLRGFFDLSGKRVVPAKYYRANDFIGNYAAVALKGEPYSDGSTTDYVPLWGVIDLDGNVIVPCRYDGVTIDPENNIITATLAGEEMVYDPSAASAPAETAGPTGEPVKE